MIRPQQSTILRMILITILLSSIVFAVPLDQNNINQLSPHQKSIIENRNPAEFDLDLTNPSTPILSDNANNLRINHQGIVAGTFQQTIPAINLPNFNPATTPSTVIQPAVQTQGSIVPEGWVIRNINSNNYMIRKDAEEFIANNPSASWEDATKSFVATYNGGLDPIKHGIQEFLRRENKAITFNALTAETSTTTETETFNVDDTKTNRLGKPLSKEKNTVKQNNAGVKISEIRNVFSATTNKQNPFASKGSIEIVYSKGDRTLTTVRDPNNNILFSIDKTAISNNFKTPKEALSSIQDPDLKEIVRQDMLGNPNIKETRWDIMTASEKIGAAFRAYNEFKGLASLTSLLSDNYNEYVKNRREYLNQRFCVFMGLGKCLESKICENKVIHSGGDSLIGSISGAPRLGAASVRGEKSFPIITSQGISFVYKVQYHLENPHNQIITYNIWFESDSSKKKWFAEDQKLQAFQEITSLPTDKNSLLKLAYNNYDKVCIRFSPGIYKFGSRSRIDYHCDIFTSDYQEPSQNEIQQAQKPSGKDGDI